MPSVRNSPFVHIAGNLHTGMRLDQFVSENENCSRTQAATLIKDGAIRLNGSLAKPAYKLKIGDIASGHVPAIAADEIPKAEPIALDVLYEDDHLVIINKPPGLVVHPAPGHSGGTIVNGLLARYPEIHEVGEKNRPGIVHRLDRDTSGALMVARTPAAYDSLTAMFASRQIDKTYLALVYGSPQEDEGAIHLPIGRHLTDRKRMSVRSKKSRTAETCWRLMKRFDNLSLVEVAIKTGRTHQIRVHFAASNMPVVGDTTYGTKGVKQAERFKDKTVLQEIKKASRQMLHAWKLRFQHPATNKTINCRAPLPADMKALLRAVNYAAASSRL